MSKECVGIFKIDTPEIDTPESWWVVCEANWEDILKLMPQFLHEPYTQEKAKQAKENRDWCYLCRCFNDIWFNLPDVIEVHSLPSFYELCALCSEEWVFHS